MGTGNLPPTRVLVGLGVTLLALLVLGVRACVGDGADDRGAAPTTSTSSTSVPDTGDPADAATTTVSIVVLPDWYPKQSSRYSDREPVVTVTTLAPTTSTTSTTSLSGPGDD
jgi:hypothetical protein